MTDYKIRPAEKADVSQLVQLCAAHAAYEKSAYSPEGKELALTKALFSDHSSLESLVVEQNQRLVGYATFGLQFSTWDAHHYLYMDCIYLEDKFRGYGIGKQLLNEIKRKALNQGCKEMQWQTPDFNEKAIKFYLREGAHSKRKERFYLDLK